MASKTNFIIIVFISLFLLGCLNTQSAQQPDDQTGDEIITASGIQNEINRSVASLERVENSKSYDLLNGSTFQLEAKIVVKALNGNNIRMYAYNGQIPGPALKVKQNSTLFINFTNNLDMETTVHWHGIRLENQYDGVPNITQDPVKPGKSFAYKLVFPDEGVYWYHPHVREDIQQELGLYGVILVEPSDNSYYNAIDREEILVLDDIMLEGLDVSPFDENLANFAIMGRFGNTMLVNANTEYQLNVNKGDVVRFFVLNTANVRTFNLSIENAKITHY